MTIGLPSWIETTFRKKPYGFFDSLSSAVLVSRLPAMIDPGLSSLAQSSVAAFEGKDTFPSSTIATSDTSRGARDALGSSTIGFPADPTFFAAGPESSEDEHPTIERQEA